MIFKVDQISTGFNMVWIAESNSKSVCTAISPFEKGRLNITMDYDDGRKQRLYYNPSDTSGGDSFTDRLSFKLFEGETLIGTIIGLNRKVKGFFQSYPYRVLRMGTEEYFLYEVGFGSKGLYLCIYRGDELIAIADKDLKVINFRDKYTVYVSDVTSLPFIMPLMMHYDITAHGDMMELAVHSSKKKIVNTIQKELIAKYDPTFIARIKAMDGIQE